MTSEQVLSLDDDFLLNITKSFLAEWYGPWKGWATCLDVKQIALSAKPNILAFLNNLHKGLTRDELVHWYKYYMQQYPKDYYFNTEPPPDHKEVTQTAHEKELESDYYEFDMEYMTPFWMHYPVIQQTVHTMKPYLHKRSLEFECQWGIMKMSYKYTWALIAHAWKF
jgi:hypothetical protein